MKFKILAVGLFIISCSTRINQYPIYTPQSFQTINYDKPFQVTVDKCITNVNAPCLSHGSISYGLVIGRTVNPDLPEKLSVLLPCDTILYQTGQILDIRPVKDPTKENSLKPIYFVKDTLINGQRTKSIVGIENKSIWGQVIKNN
jgi:hypothetical protein